MTSMYTNLAYLYIFVIALCSVCCLLRYAVLDIASKVFAMFVLFSFFNEVIALIAARLYGNNMPVYAIYSPLEFGVIALYYNYSIDVFKQKKIGYYIGAFGVFLGMLNAFFIQGLNETNSYFLIFEGIAIITMGLFSFLQLLVSNEPVHPQHNPHFWLTTILVFFWAVTFVRWSLYSYFLQTSANQLLAINIGLTVFNIFIYASIGYLYIMMPKMKRKYAK